jgi:hypothetical protein
MSTKPAVVTRAKDIHGHEVEFTANDILGHECRHVTYCQPPEPGMRDLHLIKRVTHVKIGEKTHFIPNTVPKWDYERKFWITKEGRQQHKEKREFADMEDLLEVVCTQSKLRDRVRDTLVSMTEKSRKRFGLPFPGKNDSLRKLARSPYLYGTDISSTTLLKRMYMDMFPHLRSNSSMAATDTETNMFSKEQEIIMQTMTMKDKVFTVIKKDFFKGHEYVEERLRQTFEQHLGEDIKARGLKWEVMFVDTAGQVVVEVMKKAHEWGPDFLAIWNIKFDMVKMLEALRADNIDPATVFSDPSVVRAGYHHFDFKIGPAQKVKANGDVQPLSPSQQWHVVTTPASFSFIDAMCAFRQIRTGQQEEPYYGLDEIMEKYIKRNKLNFKEADGFREGEWHKFMQEFYKFEYVIYNVFDCIGMEILDEETSDLNLNFPLYSNASDYSIFPSQPKKLCNKLFFHLLQHNRVLGSTSDQMRDENDDKTVNGKGWITMLPAHQVMDNGLQCLEEINGMPTNIRVGVGDLDIAGTYPNEGICMNISKYTTHRELIEIEGIPDHIRRRIGFNLAGGHVNAVEICCDLYKAPSLDDMYMSYLKKKGLAPPTVGKVFDTPPYKPDETKPFMPPEPMLGDEVSEPNPLDDDYDAQQAAA